MAVNDAICPPLTTIAPIAMVIIGNEDAVIARAPRTSTNTSNMSGTTTTGPIKADTKMETIQRNAPEGVHPMIAHDDIIRPKSEMATIAPAAAEDIKTIVTNRIGPHPRIIINIGSAIPMDMRRR